VQDVIYTVKASFNRAFDAARKQKALELSRVREKNRRMGEILGELGARQEAPLWEPRLGASEQPERALTVEDSEVGRPPPHLHHLHYLHPTTGGSIRASSPWRSSHETPR